MRYADELSVRRGRYVSKYPWQQIADSERIVVLRAGDDFDHYDLERVRRAAYDWARRHGYSVKSRTNHDKVEIEIQFTKDYASKPTWIELWVSSGGHPRKLTRARDRFYAGKWAEKHDYRLSKCEDGRYTLRPMVRSPFELP